MTVGRLAPLAGFRADDHPKTPARGQAEALGVVIGHGGSVARQSVTMLIAMTGDPPLADQISAVPAGVQVKDLTKRDSYIRSSSNISSTTRQLETLSVRLT
jgi:hypothetical protein